MLLTGAVIAPWIAWSASAAPPPDPYADAVDVSTGALIVAPMNAVGPPDNNGALVPATILPTPMNDLVLDMGEGEEGTGDLTVFFRGVSLNTVATVQFLDASRNLITTGQLDLVAIGDVGASGQDIVPYSAKPAPYRFVRFIGETSTYSIDAVQAATFRPDSDGDGLTDTFELQFGLNPLDTTGINGANGDPDNDGLTNIQEQAAGTNPVVADTDGDGLNDGFEAQFGLSPLDATGNNGANGDPDGDGRTNLQEQAAGTNPVVADTDGDGLSDGQEQAAGTDPNNPDTDGDGLNDGQEQAAGTNPNNPDTDGDGLRDGFEIQYGLDPLNATGNNGGSGDPDADGRTNAQEQAAGTNPVVADTDPILPGGPRKIYLPIIQHNNG